MKKKLLLFLFAMAGVGSAYAAYYDIPLAKNEFGVDLVKVDGVKDATETSLFSSANFVQVSKISNTLREGWESEENVDIWAAGNTPTITYDGSATLSTGTAVGRWLAYSVGASVYFYVEVYKQAPANHGVQTGWSVNQMPYYAGDAVEIYIANSDNTSQKQCGIGYDVNKGKAYGTQIPATNYAIADASNLGESGDKQGWILEALVPMPSNVTETNNNLKYEVAIAQEGTKEKQENGRIYGRRALVNSFSNSASNYENASSYKTATVEFYKAPEPDPINISATCSDMIIDGKDDDAIWKSSFAPKFEVKAEDVTMVSNYIVKGDVIANQLGEFQTNEDNCLSEASGNAGRSSNCLNDYDLQQGAKIAEWQVLKKGKSEGAEADSLYFFVKVYDNDKRLNSGNWISDAVELYLLVEEGGSQRINQYFIRYNENSDDSHFGKYDKIASYKQSEGEGYWTVEMTLVSNDDTKIVGLDEDYIKAELAIDVVDGDCNCRLGQIFTWRRGEYNWNSLNDDPAKQAAINLMQRLDIVAAPITWFEDMETCGYQVGTDGEGFTLESVQQMFLEPTGAPKWDAAEKVGDLYRPSINTQFRALDADGVAACPTELANAILVPTIELVSASSQDILVGESAELEVKETSSNLVSNYEWKENEQLVRENTNKYTLQDAKEGVYNYEIVGVASNGCESEAVNATVTVTVKQDKIAFPTAINISDAGVAENTNLFRPYPDENGAYDKPENVECYIFNRNGMKVYDADGAFDEIEWWNGCWKNNGSKPVDPGVYFYVLKLDDETYRGSIEVVNPK